MFKTGDIAYTQDTGAGWIKVKIIRCNGSYYIVRRLDRNTGFGVPSHRLHTEYEYLALMDRNRSLHPYSSRNAQLL